MNTVALDHILRADVYVLDVFGGVYASDKLPVQVAKYPKAYVVNVDPSDRPGSHWVAFFSSSSEKAEFFDSLGQNPEIYATSFVEFLNGNCSQWTFNNRTLHYSRRFPMFVDNIVFII